LLEDEWLASRLHNDMGSTQILFIIKNNLHKNLDRAVEEMVVTCFSVMSGIHMEYIGKTSRKYHLGNNLVPHDYNEI
jgi:hypothetical protein